MPHRKHPTGATALPRYGAPRPRSRFRRPSYIGAAEGLLSLPLLAVIAFLVSGASTVFDLAFAGLVPRLLACDELHRANARVELARSAAQVGGPAAGGALVSVLSAPTALLADSVSFIASAALIGSEAGRSRWERCSVD